MAIHGLLNALSEQTIAEQIGIPHDEARVRYAVNSNTVDDFDEYTRALGDYYNYHFTACVSNGGQLTLSEASGRAKELLERDYRRRNGDIVSAFNDAHDGTNGGLRAQLDIVAEGLKVESVERYIRSAFERYVAPNAWEDKVSIIAELIAHCGPHLGPSIRADQPERYAHKYDDLIRAYVNALQQASSVFRRL